MQEKQKSIDSPKDPPEPQNDDGTRSKDQQQRSYYYDDSHGYEVFDPATEDDEESED